MNILKSLTPSAHNNVIDLVKLAGIDVSSWSHKKQGELIKNPSINQSKIYKWSFGGRNEPTLLFIWHDSLVVDENNVVFYRNNLRVYKANLANIAGGSVKGNKRTARLRHDRAHDFEKAIWNLSNSNLPCKVALLIPHDKKDKDDIDTKSVKFRELDSEDWYVHEFNINNGEFVIVRGIRRPDRIETDSQFDLIEPAERYPTSGYAYLRALEIREKVLRRSQGKCELCGNTGFESYRNTFFLEVHHVVPLGKGGVDELWNAVAVCPNHHREAHFGIKRAEILSDLVNFLGGKYPEQLIQLQAIANNVIW